MFLKLCLNFLIVGFVFPAFGGLSTPFDLESAAVLPEGIRNARFRGMYISAGQNFNGGGQLQSLATPLNQKISWKKVLDGFNNPTDKQVLSRLMTMSGIDTSGIAGYSTAAVDISGNVNIPAIGWGITDDLSIGFAVPIYDLQVNTKIGFVQARRADGTSPSQDLVNAFENYEAKADMIANSLNDAVNKFATDNGYKRVGNQNIKGPGDAKLIAKYKVHKDLDNSIATRVELTVPTGTAPDADRLVDLPTGDGQWDLGAFVLWDRTLPKNFSVNSFMGYTIQMPDVLDRRIPEEQGSPLASLDSKEKVYRDSGDIFTSGVGLNYAAFQNTLEAGVGYTFQYQAPTSFKGSKFDAVRYQWLEELNPEQNLHALTYKVGISTLQRYKTGSIGIPLQTYVAYSVPVAGKNTNRANVISAEVLMYF